MALTGDALDLLASVCAAIFELFPVERSLAEETSVNLGDRGDPARDSALSPVKPYGDRSSAAYSA